jgi:hypothetical protein
MPKSTEYLAILRCQTWNVWPEKTGIEHSQFRIDYGAAAPLLARLVVISYANRTATERYLNEETKLGPLIWDGKTQGLHQVGETVLKAPEDVVEVELVHRNAQRGEVDICINFRIDDELPPSLVEALRATAFAVMSLLNLRLNDCLVPAAPFQLRKVLAGGGGELESAISLSVHTRQAIDHASLETALSNVVSVLLDSPYGEKLRVALELYAAHFTEKQTRVRFLLLVIAMESLAQSSTKHQVAMDLLCRWQDELTTELQKHDPSSEQYQSLGALSRELSFRAEDSIRSQVRKLFANLPGISEATSIKLQRTALRVYDKRSTLVHDGHLPAEDLSILEDQARELLKTVFAQVIASRESPDSLGR